MSYIITAIFIALIINEKQQQDKKIIELTNKKVEIEKENQTLKLGRNAFSIGEKKYFLSEYESLRYENWRKFYYKNDYLFGYNIKLDNDTFYDTIILGILENKSNEDILKELKHKECVIKKRS